MMRREGVGQATGNTEKGREGGGGWEGMREKQGCVRG